MLSKNQAKEIQALHQRKQRDEYKRFFAEGVKTVLEILNARPDILLQIFATQEFLKKNASLLRQVNCAQIEISDEELSKISLQNTPNQVLAVCKYFDVAENSKGPDFALYLDDIRDPGNFGTILRLCDWFGFRKVYCSPSTCERYNPKVIQSTMGAFLRVQTTYSDIAEIASEYPVIYGAVLGGSDLYKMKLQPGLLVIGNEANGIREQTMKYIHEKITIPAGPGSGAESLNAAVAAAIMTAEFFRQIQK